MKNILIILLILLDLTIISCGEIFNKEEDEGGDVTVELPADTTQQ